MHGDRTLEGAWFRPRRGEPVFTLIDPKSVWVLAYIDESSRRMRVGEPAEIVLRSVPADAISGRLPDRARKRPRQRAGAPDPDWHSIVCRMISISANRPKSTLRRCSCRRPSGAGSRHRRASRAHHGTVWTVEDGHLQQREVTLGHRLSMADGDRHRRRARQAMVVTQLQGALRAGRAVTIAPASRKAMNF